MRNCTRDIVYPQSRFFPGMRPMVDAELPSSERCIGTFEAAGLLQPRPRKCDSRRGWQLAGVCRQVGATRGLFLARLPDSEFEIGIGRASRLRQRQGPEAITEQIDFFVFERWA